MCSDLREVRESVVNEAEDANDVGDAKIQECGDLLALVDLVTTERREVSLFV